MHDKHHHKDQQDGMRPRRQGGPHAFRLFLLNVVLYAACGAFAGAVAMDYLPVPQQMKVLSVFIAVPIVMAIIATITHVHSHKWTSVDDMAERMLNK